ncbi:MAG: GDSL-type esterase/lipase family protein [Acidobacteriota bacterium]|nr:GDSL-type esterase/lipase family protein [Acidobacteriota bacterium]
MLLIYLLLVLGWTAFTATALIVKRGSTRTFLLRFSYVVLILFFAEAACIIGFYLMNHRWTFNDQSEYVRTLFEAHPYLIGAGKPNAHVTHQGVTYTHNIQGFRGKDFPAKTTKLRVVTIGGSTTYGIGVNDDETWPAQLEHGLGEKYEVLNMGIPGHSTAEHINMLSLIVPQYSPDILVMNVGLNDLRNIHVKNLAPDYSDYHAPTFSSALGLCSDGMLERFACGKLVVWSLQRLWVFPRCILRRHPLEEDSSPQAEQVAMQVYRRNLETLIAIAKNKELKPILVPQVLVKERFQGGRLKWWIPFVEDDQLIGYLNQYNAVTEDVARHEGVYFAAQILQQPWTKDDFADPSHLSAGGNRKFASELQKIIFSLEERNYRTRSN